VSYKSGIILKLELDPTAFWKIYLMEVLGWEFEFGLKETYKVRRH